jgi:hypothetical protein
MKRIFNAAFQNRILILLIMLLAMSTCGYSGPKMTYIVEMNFGSWLMQEANDPSDPQLQAVLSETSRIAATGSVDKIEALKQALQQKNMVRTGAVLVLSTGRIRPQFLRRRSVPRLARQVECRKRQACHLVEGAIGWI